ncbi:uncharacterized protein LOC141713703 [Apium graveolens]|uniref:uncharacterized protein LOC141713703 n=1 Tax=Apium graveolens TaxID=4045 RepID=UPI003D7B17A6
MTEAKIIYKSIKDHTDFPITEKAVSESPLMKARYLKEKEKNPEKKLFVFGIPGISKHILSIVVAYCENKPQDLRLLWPWHPNDPFVVVNLIQAAHFLMIKKLMDMACLLLAKSVFLAEIDDSGFYKDRDDRDDCSHMLRSRSKDTFINHSGFLDVHFSRLVLSQLHFIKTWQDAFDKHFRKIVNFKNLEELLVDICSFEEFICADPRAACRINVGVVQFLIKILNNTDYNINKRNDIQRPIISILSRAKLSIWGEQMQMELFPILIKFMHHPENGLAVSAVIALTRVTYDFPDCIKVFIDLGVLDAAHKALSNHLEVYWGMEHLAKFLVTICRGHSSFPCLSSEKVANIVTILESICLKWPYQYRMVHIFTCYALSYLSYGRCVVLEEKVWQKLQQRLVVYISFHDTPGPECRLGIRASVSRKVNLDQMLAGSALGVVGNIMRWGDDDQMLSLIEVPRFWNCLKGMLYSFENFQKEALQIISNLAAKRIPFKIDAIWETIKSLGGCSYDFVSDDVRMDVRMEAAWAVFNIISSKFLVHNGLLIDEYPVER